MNINELIESIPETMRGKPIIRGTRIPVELIVRKMGEGASIEDLLDGYPVLTRESIQSALIYAADVIGNENIIYLKTGTSN